MMKNVNLQIEVEIHPSVIWRLKLFMAIMRFAVWVGGFGGVEFDIPERNLTPLALDAAMPPSAEPDSGLENVPAAESDTQPRK